MSVYYNPTPFLPGFRLFDGGDLNDQLANPISGVETAITATAGGSQSTSYQLSKRFNVATVVATAADGVKLPTANPGTEIIIINAGASALQVFTKASASTINGTSGATGVSQAAGTTAAYRCTAPGVWRASGGVAGIGSFTALSVSGLLAESGAGVSAAGTNQATGTALAANLNQLTTVGASTGVVMPAAVAGLALMIANKGANNVQVYGNGSDTIDGTAGATGVTLGHTAGTNSCMFFCCVAGTWISAKLGAVSA